jgi:hypothetical protein
MPNHNIYRDTIQSRRPISEDVGLPWPDRVVILRGQLTIIRKRVEQGIPASIKSIRRAEELARTLEDESKSA